MRRRALPLVTADGDEERASGRVCPAAKRALTGGGDELLSFFQRLSTRAGGGRGVKYTIFAILIYVRCL